MMVYCIRIVESTGFVAYHMNIFFNQLLLKVKYIKSASYVRNELKPLGGLNFSVSTHTHRKIFYIREL